MSLYFGPENDLENLIRTHLFVICPNNSGSTFLKFALATSKRTWNLAREGQHTFGFAGPSARKLGRRVWASKQEWIDVYTNPENYDWSKSQRAWYFQASSRDKTAKIFVEKSPTFLLVVKQLVEHFKNARFLFMVRNPYAVVEGIRRISPRNWRESLPDSEIVTVAAEHVLHCLKYQCHNIKKWADRGVFFTYEQMCGEPEKVQDLIRGLVPQIDDLVLSQRLRVKQYNEELRNMNDQQIERLSPSDLEEINKVFSRYPGVMEFFNYSFLE